MFNTKTTRIYATHATHVVFSFSLVWASAKIKRKGGGGGGFWPQDPPPPQTCWGHYPTLVKVTSAIFIIIIIIHTDSSYLIMKNFKLTNVLIKSRTPL